MKQSLRLSLITTVFLVMGTGVISVVQSDFSLTTWSNLLTMVGLVFLIVGLFLTIIQSGSFDFFAYSVQAARRLLQKTPQKTTPFVPEEGLSTRVWGNKCYFLQVAGLLLVISLILGIV